MVRLELTETQHPWRVLLMWELTLGFNQLKENDMKNKLLILSLIILGITSCRKELLSPEPQKKLFEDVSFSTPEKTLAAINGVYAGAKVGKIYGGLYFNYQDARREKII